MGGPEAIQRAGFSKISGRALAQSARDNKADTADGKVSSKSCANSLRIVAKCIMDGQHGSLQRVRMDSLRDPLVFWITNTVADETKLWYYIRGHGVHKFSTLSWHSQVTWLGGDRAPAIRDEDVIRTPEAMEAYNAATQKNILCSDPIAGVNPQPGLRPLARFYGSIMEWDSHKVNSLTAKFVRAEMPKSDLLLPSNCLQHHTGNACTSVTKYLNIFTRVWTLHKTFAEGDFYLAIRKFCHAILEDEEEGLDC